MLRFLFIATFVALASAGCGGTNPECDGSSTRVCRATEQNTFTDGIVLASSGYAGAPSTVRQNNAGTYMWNKVCSGGTKYCPENFLVSFFMDDTSSVPPAHYMMDCATIVDADSTPGDLGMDGSDSFHCGNIVSVYFIEDSDHVANDCPNSACTVGGIRELGSNCELVKRNETVSKRATESTGAMVVFGPTDDSKVHHARAGGDSPQSEITTANNLPGSNANTAVKATTNPAVGTGLPWCDSLAARIDSSTATDADWAKCYEAMVLDLDATSGSAPSGPQIQAMRLFGLGGLAHAVPSLDTDFDHAKRGYVWTKSQPTLWDNGQPLGSKAKYLIDLLAEVSYIDVMRTNNALGAGHASNSYVGNPGANQCTVDTFGAGNIDVTTDLANNWEGEAWDVRKWERTGADYTTDGDVVAGKVLSANFADRATAANGIARIRCTTYTPPSCPKGTDGMGVFKREVEDGWLPAEGMDPREGECSGTVGDDPR